MYSESDPDYNQIIDILTKATKLSKKSEYSKFLMFVKQEVAKQYYQKAKNLYQEPNPDYDEILNLMNQVNNLVDNKIYSVFYVDVQNKYNKILEEAETLYQQAKSLFNESEKDYANIIEKINQAICLYSKNEYQDFLNEVGAEWENKRKAEELYSQALNLYDNTEPDLTQVVKLVQQAINTFDKEEYHNFLKKINLEYEQYSQAEAYYEEAKELFNEQQKNYAKVIELTNKAIYTYNRQKYHKFIDNVNEKREIDYNKSQELYSQAQNLFNNKNYSETIDILYKAIDLCEKQEYYDLLSRAEKEYEIQKNKETAKNLYEQAQTMYETQNCSYSDVINLMNDVIKIDNDSIYQNFLEKVQKDYEIQNLFKKAKDLYSKSQPNYENIIDIMQKILKYKSDTIYKNFLNEVEKTYNEEAYDLACRYYDEKKYNLAKVYIKKAVAYAPNNNTYLKLYDKLESYESTWDDPMSRGDWRDWK